MSCFVSLRHVTEHFREIHTSNLKFSARETAVECIHSQLLRTLHYWSLDLEMFESLIARVPDRMLKVRPRSTACLLLPASVWIFTFPIPRDSQHTNSLCSRPRGILGKSSPQSFTSLAWHWFLGIPKLLSHLYFVCVNFFGAHALHSNLHNIT